METANARKNQLVKREKVNLAMIEILGMISATLMPLWNIPLILRIWKRKSSKDISIFWVLGVWLCVMGILPSAIISQDAIFKLFCIVNSILFSLVLMVVLKFR